MPQISRRAALLGVVGALARRLFEALRSTERAPDTTIQSQSDTQRDAQPGPLGRRAATLAAHRQAAEERA